jgi:hypothetical protein
MPVLKSLLPDKSLISSPLLRVVFLESFVTTANFEHLVFATAFT